MITKLACKSIKYANGAVGARGGNVLVVGIISDVVGRIGAVTKYVFGGDLHLRVLHGLEIESVGGGRKILFFLLLAHHIGHHLVF